MEPEIQKELRYVTRLVESPEHKDGSLLMVVKVLQQKWVDGWGQNYYWKDVPTINEETK